MENKFLYAGEFYNGPEPGLEYEAVKLLKENCLLLSCAESCTGGLLCKRITEVSGASEVFECGIISYANKIKHELLSVEEEMLQKYGAVSFAVAAQMAKGALQRAKSDIAVSITGIAGPNSDNTNKKVGLVYVALYDKNENVFVKELNIDAPKDRTRQYNRYVSSSYALSLVIDYIENHLQMQPYDEFMKKFC